MRVVEAIAVGGDDAGRLLPAMLQRVQPEVGDVGGLGVTVDAEDAAHGIGTSASETAFSTTRATAGEPRAE